MVHAPKANVFRPSWRPPQCVGRRPRLAGARRWPGATACGAQVWPWRGWERWRFPSRLLGPSWRTPQDAAPPVAGSHVGSPKLENRKEAQAAAETLASLAFSPPGVVAVVFCFAVLCKDSWMAQPLALPTGPSQKASLLWRHLLAYSPSRLCQCPQEECHLAGCRR